MPDSKDTPIVEMRHIYKSFGAVRALSDVNLVLYPGEILGLVGDNSAGKSTLMKIMTGAYQRDTGDILVSGKPVHFRSPHESRDLGIEMIYQDFALCGNMDVGQNIFLGRWPRRGIFINRRKMYDEASVVLKRLKVDVNSVFQRVESLSGGERNRVHLAKVLRSGANVLLLDEPTNDLDVETLQALEAALEDFAGCAVVISHDRWFLDRLATHILAFEGDSQVDWFEGNFEAYEEDKKRRLGADSLIPHRIKFQKFARG